jgi:hypothetical protein
LRASVDGSAKKAPADGVGAAADTESELSLRTVYPSLSIDKILTNGAKLGKSIRGAATSFPADVLSWIHKGLTSPVS